MIDVDLPHTEGVPEIVRSFAACVASVTETPLSDVPKPRADLRGAIAHWRSWLAGRGTGLVPIANPARFNWPGYWLAVLDDMDGERPADDRTAVLMLGILPGSSSARKILLSWAPQRPICQSARVTCYPGLTRHSPRPVRRSPHCAAE